MQDTAEAGSVLHPLGGGTGATPFSAVHGTAETGSVLHRPESRKVVRRVHVQDTAETGSVLVNLSPIVRALAKATTVPAVKEIRDKAEAVLRYVKQRKESEEIQLQAGLLKIRAERRLGELLDNSIRHRGGKSKNESCSMTQSNGQLLPEGVTRNQSSAWQRIALIPAKEFEEEVQTIEEKKLEPTTAHFVRLGSVYARDLKKQRERQEQYEAKREGA